MKISSNGVDVTTQGKHHTLPLPQSIETFTTWGYIYLLYPLSTHLPLSFWDRLTKLKIKKNNRFQYVTIDVFNQYRISSSDMYFSMIQEFVSSARTLGIPVNNHTDTLFLNDNPDDPKLRGKQDIMEGECEFCHHYMKYPLMPEPYLVECGKCHKALMFVYCPKCGIGGEISSEFKTKGIGTISSMDGSADHWICSGCSFKWPIDKSVYTINPTVSQ